MRRYTRFLAFLLALVTIVASFAGCSDPIEEITTEKKSQSIEETTLGTEEITELITEEEYKPDIEQKDYNAEFYLNIMDDVNPADCYWVKESSNNALSDAVYARQEKVRDYLGVEIVSMITENEGKYIEPFKNAVKNKDGSVDLLISHVYYGIDGFITGNYLTDFNDVPEINLDAPYWKYDFMDQLAAGGHFYLGFSDYNIVYTHVITYNKDMLKLYEDQLDEDIYATVENYRWTLDKMISIANLSYIDATSDGKTKDDTFGFYSDMNIGYAGLLQAFDIQTVEQDEKGSYKMAIYNEKNKEKMSIIVDKLYNLVRSDCAYMTSVRDEGRPRIYNGRALMQIDGTLFLSDLLQYDFDFGILPYPMYDENQKDVGYRHLQWGGYLCIPSYLGDATMVAETIEMLSYYSDDVNIAFYEKMLGKQVADVPQDRKMLDIVWDGVCSDVGQTYYSVIKDNNSLLYALTRLTELDTTQNLASYVATTENSVNRKLKKFFANVT